MPVVKIVQTFGNDPSGVVCLPSLQTSKSPSGKKVETPVYILLQGK
jgi:hypothetical protein